MIKKIILGLAALTFGIMFSIFQPITLKSIGEEKHGKSPPDIRVKSAEIVAEEDNRLTVRYHLRNHVESTPISACGEINYTDYPYAWGCKPVIIPPYAGNIEITYTLASTARSIECSDSVTIFLYVGTNYHFYVHKFAYDKVWHKNPDAESWETYKARGCEPPRSISELQKL